LKRGHIPNIFAEMGWKSEFKYNRAGALRKIAVTSALMTIAVCLLKQKRR
jgi:hypothetical protein